MKRVREVRSFHNPYVVFGILPGMDVKNASFYFVFVK